MNKKIFMFTIVILFTLFIIGCNKSQKQQDSPEFKEKTPTKQVDIVHLENLKAYLKGDAEDITNAFSPNYLDMYRSVDGKKADVSKNYFKKCFETDNYKACKKMKIDELVNTEEVKVYTYDEIMKMDPAKVGVINSVGFEYKDGDILIKFPKKDNSPMVNGWNGVYRQEDGYWKIVAGNF